MAGLGAADQAQTSGGLSASTTRRVTESFAVGAGQVTAVLRLPLLALIALIGPVVDSPVMNYPLFHTVLVGYASWSLAVAWWMFTRPVAAWAAWLTTGVDLVALVTLAAASNGSTSYIQPVFFLYPIVVAFQYRPVLTAAVGTLIAGGYAGIWLRHLGQNGGPDIPGVVWLHFALLLWMAAATTTLTTVLVHRSRRVLRLLDVQRMLTTESLAVIDRERARLAEELHDGPLQNIIAARRNLEELTDGLPHAAVDALVTQTDQLLRDTAAALRGTVTVLHPQVLAQLGLAPALAELAARAADLGGFIVTTDLGEGGPLPHQDLLYSTARELLTNTVKHAHARHVTLTLHRAAIVAASPLAASTGSPSPAAVILTVTDDGTGFDPAVLTDRVRHGHIGLASRTLRITELGGTITLAPGPLADGLQPGRGTTVTVTLPLPTAGTG